MTIFHVPWSIFWRFRFGRSLTMPFSNQLQWWAGSGHETRGYEDNSDHRVTRSSREAAIRDPSNLLGDIRSIYVYMYICIYLYIHIWCTYYIMQNWGVNLRSGEEVAIKLEPLKSRPCRFRLVHAVQSMTSAATVPGILSSCMRPKSTRSLDRTWQLIHVQHCGKAPRGWFWNIWNPNQSVLRVLQRWFKPCPNWDTSGDLPEVLAFLQFIGALVQILLGATGFAWTS